jgi:hypothetical protein
MKTIKKHWRTLKLFSLVVVLTSGYFSTFHRNIDAAPQELFEIAKINFQPDGSRVPTGYNLDIGEEYNDQRGFGWIEQASLGTTDHKPLNIYPNTRDRARSGVIPLLNTVILMQVPTSSTNASLVKIPAAWEYSLPNGFYTVKVSVGDQAPYDSDHVINIEGVNAISHFKGSSGKEYKDATIDVYVNDGRLTVDAIGGVNTILNYVEIFSADINHKKKVKTPNITEAKASNKKVKLTWLASDAQSGVAGYNIYCDVVPLVDPEVLTPINGTKPVKNNSFTHKNLANGTTYYYRIVAVDENGSMLSAGLVENATPTAITDTVNIKVNFQDEVSVPPTGYIRDFGEAYGSRTGNYQGSGLTYGWVKPGTTTPVSLVGFGRNRAGTGVDQRLATLMHMQKSPAGSWELVLPNGSYHVTVTSGDPSYTDSTHMINIEGTTAINLFKPNSTNKFSAATSTVNLTDGRLTISANGGTNTKINMVVIKSAVSTLRPTVSASTPANNATNVKRDTAVTAEVALPNSGQGIDTEALTEASVKLIRNSDKAQIPAKLNTSGGGDVIVLQPNAFLSSNTSYTFTVNTGLTDTGGSPFTPFTSTFTTGTCCDPVATTIKFQKVALPNSANKSFTSVAIGPDGKLYAATLNGEILRYPLNADGTTGTAQSITSIQVANGGSRAIIGIAFDPAATASNLVLWVSNNAPSLDNASDWSGKITRLSGPNLENVTDYVTNLPRSIRDHMTNSLAFGPDGALYFPQGSNTAMGAPDNAWGNRAERQLTGAILRFDPSLVTSPPINVKTQDGGTYNPFAAGAPLTIYASGTRNAYDLLWHSNGQLYVPTNGSAAGGNTPATPSTLPSACSNRMDDSTNGDYTGPQVSGITNVSVAQNDFLFRVVRGGYYGHPNPARCEWVMNGGNPTSGTDKSQVSQYPVGTNPDRNWRGAAFDFNQHYSPNGVIEYKSSTFNGGLKGKILVVRYSAGDDIIALTPGGTNLDITASQTGITGLTGFSDPLDLVENPINGYLYVTELGANKITLLKPTL